jgi:hypothetical protein
MAHNMARRPRASVLDVVDSAANLGLNTVQLRRQSKLRSELENVRRQHELGTKYTLMAIEGLYDLHLANGHKLMEIECKLDELAKISWDIASYFDRKEQQEKFIGIMRFYIHSTNRSLDEIDSYAGEYPEYALLEVNRIIKSIEEKGVKVEHFSQVSMEEMRLAQGLLDRVYGTKDSLLRRM